MSQVVLDDSVGVTDHLNLVLAKVLECADQEIANRMAPKIGRDEAETEPILRMAEVPGAGNGTEKGRRVLAVVCGMGIGQCRQRDAWAIMKRIE